MQLSDLTRRHTNLGQVHTSFVGATRQLSQPPFTGRSGLAAGIDCRLEEVKGTCVDGRGHVRFGELPLGRQTRLFGGWQLWQLGTQLLNPLPRRCNRHQIWLGEIAVVLGVRLVASGDGVFAGLLPHSGLLTDLASLRQQVSLTLNFVPQRSFHRAQRVDVLRLGTGA